MNDVLTIRRARAGDEYAITALVRSDRLNPLDLDWRRFVLAVDESGIVGAVQLRWHDDDSRELASLIVRDTARGRGVAARMIERLLAPTATRVWMITGAAFAHHYARWGFQPVAASDAPAGVRRNYHLGRIVGGLLSRLRGRAPRALAVLQRPAPR